MEKPQRKWILSVQSGANETEVIDEIETIIQIVGLDRIAPARYSAAFALSLFAGFKSDRVHLGMVSRELEALEKENETGTRGATQFRHYPLGGLWHKHFMQADLASFARNIQRGLHKFGIPYVQQKVREAEAAGEARYFTPEDAAAIARDAAEGNWKRLRMANDITGEWIIFAIHEGQNYYLTLATHEKSTHGEVRKVIDALCCQEFPWLREQLSNPPIDIAS